MTATDFDVERTYNETQFSAVKIFRSDRMKVVCGYFKPGQFIPVHAPKSDVAIQIQSGTGVVRDGETDHRVDAGDIVVVEAETDRAIKADDDSCLEALLITAPPPSDAEHKPVRIGLQTGQFDPDGDNS